MGLKTPLYDRHVAGGAKIIDFGGWDMPLHYGSQIAEHLHVRKAAGVFDVSHMGVVDVEGPGAEAYLRHLLANDVARLVTPGKALYTCMLNPAGGVIDDLIVFYRSPGCYRAVINAATRGRDMTWMQNQLEGFDCTVRERADRAMVAVQGPRAMALVGPVLGADVAHALATLDPFMAVESGQWFVSRTGYTGEDGVEIILPADQAGELWDELIAAGCRPCGLGARDTLRLEAGMNLCGADMDETTSPLESGLAWTIAWDPEDRGFVGRAALESSSRERMQVGLVLLGRGVLRSHQRVLVDGLGEGEVTSGSFSPTLERSIGLARVPVGTAGTVQVDVRGRLLDAKVVKPPFVRNGRVRVALD